VTDECEVGGNLNNHSGTALPSDIQRGRYVTVRFCVENFYGEVRECISAGQQSNLRLWGGAF